MPRQYDIVLFGATGYTGKLTAQYIAKHLPTDIKWAVAGRSHEKLTAVVNTCKALNADRIQPEIEVCELDDVQLSDLARKTKVLISTVGPYAIHGEHALKACATNGTHYVDVTGESTWNKKMIEKYDKAARTSGACCIPQIGLESAPADLITLALVSQIRKECSAPTGEVILSLHDIKAAPSGGTLATVFAQVEVFSLGELAAANKPFALSPIPGPKTSSGASLFSKIFGVRTVPDLGCLTTSIAQVSDVPVVQRSWGLLGGPSFYGPNFHFEEYMKTRNHLTGILTHFAMMLGMMSLAISPIRWLARKLVYQPGEGATVEETAKERVEYRGVATADEAQRRRAYARATWEGGIYELTGTLLAEACMTLLKDETFASKQGGGVMTAACLGQPFIDRLRKAGLKMEVKMLT